MFGFPRRRGTINPDALCGYCGRRAAGHNVATPRLFSGSTGATTRMKTTHARTRRSIGRCSETYIHGNEGSGNSSSEEDEGLDDE